jgi:hypothetical protein
MNEKNCSSPEMNVPFSYIPVNDMMGVVASRKKNRGLKKSNPCVLKERNLQKASLATFSGGSY